MVLHEAIQKWVSLTPKYSKKRWRLGLRPGPSPPKQRRSPSALASLTRRGGAPGARNPQYATACAQRGIEVIQKT